ncbi:MAG: flagellar basal body rod protein FlgC [Lachnospiraceae bacterium]
MNMFDSFDISASGLTAQRLRMDVIAENVANAETTRTADGTPYRRQVVMFEQQGKQTPFSHVLNEKIDHLNRGIDQYTGSGVKVTGVFDDTWDEMVMVYEPDHPDADENGYVMYPNVNIIQEMTDLIDATRSYEANTTAFNASKTMAMKGLDMVK